MRIGGSNLPGQQSGQSGYLCTDVLFLFQVSVTFSTLFLGSKEMTALNGGRLDNLGQLLFME
jgi:hypothetical protein